MCCGGRGDGYPRLQSAYFAPLAIFGFLVDIYGLLMSSDVAIDIPRGDPSYRSVLVLHDTVFSSLLVVRIVLFAVPGSSLPVALEIVKC